MISRRSMIATAGAAVGLPALDLFHMGSSAGAETPGSAIAAGYRMPIESVRHERTFMQWPSRAGIYGRPRGLDTVRTNIVLIANSIARFEPVVVLARAEQAADAAARLGPAIAVWPISTDDLWCRDSGPTFVVTSAGGLAVSDLGFNGWGNKQGHADDGRIAERVAQRLRLPLLKNGIVGEGGGVEVDGDGTALAHASSWINRNRNSGSRQEIERQLLDALGAEHMIWAPGVSGADITDFHIDALARFVRPGQVVIQLRRTPDRRDPWSVAAFETYEILKAARDARGRKLDIVVIPEPKRMRVQAPDFVASYVNYYVCNGAVIAAEFGDDKADAEASDSLRQLYPDREIVLINVDAIGAAGGGIHCTTQQQPATGP
jgi:agmatine deiminase